MHGKASIHLLGKIHAFKNRLQRKDVSLGQLGVLRESDFKEEGALIKFGSLYTSASRPSVPRGPAII